MSSSDTSMLNLGDHLQNPDAATSPAGSDSRRITEASMEAFLAASPKSRPGSVIQYVDTTTAPSGSLQERLYNSGAACKLIVAAVAMHLDRDWRTRFFAISIASIFPPLTNRVST